MPNPETAFALWSDLLRAGLYTNVSLPPATPNGLALLRSSVSAAHTPQQIDRAIALFEQTGRALGLVPAIAVARPSHHTATPPSLSSVSSA
jgi:8-amino-7-oxononanoate synthase